MHVGRSRAMDGYGSVPSSCHAGRSVYVGFAAFPVPYRSIDLLIGWSAGRRHIDGRLAYMGVPPLFSFLGGSGSGTVSGRVLGYSGVLCR